MHVTLTTAIELSDAEISSAKKALEKKLGREITLKNSVNPSVLGGVAVSVGSAYYDGTVKAKLEKVSAALKEGNGNG